jgi:hypothetical protein
MLSGLDQKVCGQVRGLQCLPSRMTRHRPKGTTLPRSDRRDERSNPRCLPAREGGLQRTLMRQRGRDEGGSQCRSVMERIEGESSTKMGRPRRNCRPDLSVEDDIPSPRKRADFPRVFRHERTAANRLRETSRYVGSRNACWCGSQSCTRLALPRREEGRVYGPSAPGAYREGYYQSGRVPRGAFVKA